MSLREQAKAAYEEHHAAVEAEQAEKRTAIGEKVRARFVEKFGVEPDDVRGYNLTVDDLDMRWDEGRFNVVRHCPHCGAEVLVAAENITSLGRIITDIDEDVAVRHNCTPTMKDIAFAEMLIDKGSANSHVDDGKAWYLEAIAQALVEIAKRL